MLFGSKKKKKTDVDNRPKGSDVSLMADDLSQQDTTKGGNDDVSNPSGGIAKPKRKTHPDEEEDDEDEEVIPNWAPERLLRYFLEAGAHEDRTVTMESLM